VKRSRVITAVRKALRGAVCPRPGETLLVGLSGGADSVALLDALASLAPAGGFRLVAAHLDHGLRAGSAEDAAFCADLCARLGIPLRTGRADVGGRARRDHEGLEAAGRRERQAFLRRLARQEGAVAIALAHTRDDQAETLLLRLLRGAGRRGLSAMRPHGGGLLRPLLEVSRADVLAHLAARGLAWHEDETNADPVFLRNRVRHELIPYLEARFNPNLRAALARSARLLGDEARLLEGLAGELRASLERADGEGVALARPGLAAAPLPLARLALRQALADAGVAREVSADQVERILELARSPRPGRLELPGGRLALLRSGLVRLLPSRPALLRPPFAEAPLAVTGGCA
jgi:tRNA(Ile)-lysidine synthase